MWFQVNTTEGKLLICNLYSPPNQGDFWEHLDANLEFVKSESTIQNIPLLGDLNADFGTNNGKKLLELCTLHNLLCHIKDPTRITSETSSCLGQIISNIPNFVSSVNVEPPISTNDHHTIGANLRFHIKPDLPYYRSIWLYDQGNYEGFITALEMANWDSCFTSDDVDMVCSMWTDMFLHIAKIYILNGNVLIRPKDSPWYSCEL